MAGDIDLQSAASVREPAAYFAGAMERGAVQWSAVHRGWVVLSHEEVETAFRDDKRLSADRSGSFQRSVAGRSEALERAGELLSTWMNFRDPPVHTRLRQPVKGAFTPRRVSELDERVLAVADEVIDGFDGDVVDLTSTFAKPIPALIIAAILGVESGERTRFEAWSHDLSKLVFSTQPGVDINDSVGEASDEFMAFFRELVARERVEPTGSLLSVVVNETGTELSALELMGVCTLLLFAGHETTQTLLSNTLGMLLERDDLMHQMRTGQGIDETAVDEFLRTVGPARAMIRKASVTHERGGQTIERGQNVYLSIAAANHDPAMFNRPGEVDLWRDPNPHLGFGWGPHFCLGTNLARLEARIVIRRLLERFPRIEAAGPIAPLHASTTGFGRRPVLARVSGEC